MLFLLTIGTKKFSITIEISESPGNSNYPGLRTYKWKCFGLTTYSEKRAERDTDKLISSAFYEPTFTRATLPAPREDLN